MREDFQQQEHIGDGVYVAHDGYQIWVRANDHHWGTFNGATEVALEPGVLLALIRYAESVGLIFKRDKE